jgi:hypothetical protein
MTTPKGIITLWHGTSGSIPVGWVVCDGTNDTPDLRSMFVYGASINGDVGITGGSAVHNHACAGLVASGAHTHRISDNSSGNSTSTSANGATGTTNAATGHDHSASGTSDSRVAHSHSVADSATSSSLPPYYKLFYIMAT